MTPGNGIKRIISGNRLYWVLAVIALPVPAFLACAFFGIGCKCSYGAATGRIFEIGLYLIWIRLFVGLVLGENRKKVIVYLLMPFVIGFEASTLGNILWPHAHSLS